MFTIQEMLNMQDELQEKYKDIQTTMDIYAEATEQKKHESFERLAAKLNVF